MNAQLRQNLHQKTWVSKRLSQTREFLFCQNLKNLSKSIDDLRISYFTDEKIDQMKKD